MFIDHLDEVTRTNSKLRFLAEKLYLQLLILTLTEVSCLFFRILLCARSRMTTTSVTKSIPPAIPPVIMAVLSLGFPLGSPVTTYKHIG